VAYDAFQQIYYMSLEFIRSILTEWYKKDSFYVLLEAVLTESYIKLNDFETSPNFRVDHTGIHTEPKQVSLAATDFVSLINPGSSISRSGYLFLPMKFAMSPIDGATVIAHISALVRSGEVTVTGYPGFGIDDGEWQGAYPARFYKTFGFEAKQQVEDQLGTGLVIAAINGEPLSRWLTRPAHITATNGSIWGKGEVPEWLEDVAVVVDEAVRNGKVNAERSRIEGFEGDLVLSSSQGDSILLISKDPAKAAYILRKKIAGTDWDVWITTKMKELYSKYRRKPIGTKKENALAPNLDTKRRPKLSLRDILIEVDGGYALRRAIGFRQNQQMRDELKKLINNGVNYADGRALADISV
jgi:hypothetical protein